MVSALITSLIAGLLVSGLVCVLLIALLTVSLLIALLTVSLLVSLLAIPLLVAALVGALRPGIRVVIRRTSRLISALRPRRKGRLLRQIVVVKFRMLPCFRENALRCGRPHGFTALLRLRVRLLRDCCRFFCRRLLYVLRLRRDTAVHDDADQFRLSIFRNGFYTLQFCNFAQITKALGL